ncbi:MAG: DUF885 domain-containing protein [Planctomycetes bacterium]|nr:DUF885 domain-containing protein [Planctomycetota bacterium]
MKYLLVALIPFLFVTPLQAATPEDAVLEKFFRQYLDKYAKTHPVEASRLGDYRYADAINDLSPKARADDGSKAALEDLVRVIDRGKLSRDGRIDYEILKHHLEYTIWSNENSRPFEEDPRVWNEYLVDSVYLLLTQSTLEKDKVIRQVASRIEAIPRVVLQARESLKNPMKAHLETAIRQNRGAIAFYEKGIFEITGETPQLSPLAKPAKLAVEALQAHQKHLESLLPDAKGEWRIGKAKFAKKLELELDAGISADEALKEAEAEADRVRRDMYVIARQLWSKTIPGQPLPPDDADGRRETIRRVLIELGKDHGTPETLVADTRATIADLKKFIKEKDILRLPDPDRCDINLMPEFQRGNSTAYLNPAPPLDPKARSFYAVSPPPKDWDARRVSTYFEEYNRAMLKILSIHEGYPGHYVQLEYSNRHPSLIRRVLQSGVFAEGWAVYTEQMLLDQGFGNGDLSLRLHQLKFYLRAVINTILDHRMHCEKMTDEEALKLLVEGGFQAEGEAVAKIVRAKQSSVQLSTYFVGRMAFYRLRQKVSRELGDKFDLGRYHEAVLDHGTLPVKYLPELVGERLKRGR